MASAKSGNLLQSTVLGENRQCGAFQINTLYFIKHQWRVRICTRSTEMNKTQTWPSNS